ncbi:hypothetical protein FBZ83_104227 [Azospirillum brasilense]|uniref:Uncharacterized protein n=1 Tax=Azospirillum brasilense TaxID=192 RepID=A0A560CJC2_AZOBR|nr:hypothetical protein [Azospirillum brasilense]MBK3731998.1 hypothetical protein [Azospirillum brasilense]TWA84958.1 hypothetical protein FBZ83_104227 [Azospirillum brasilense]
MADNLLTSPVPGALPAAPAVPEKFRDPGTGAVRVEALLKSYLELERKLSAPASGDDERPDLLRAPGVPDGPEGYCIACDHGLFEPDPAINGRLHGAGFTPEQAQLVYDLAAERLVPLIQELAAEFQAEREVERLSAQFGGAERWREVSRQLHAWAVKNLPPAAVEGLSTTYEGVMALHRMMTGGEPAALSMPAGAPSAGGEAELQALMRDPRYWRDRDPAVVSRVTDGFRRLYPTA